MKRVIITIIYILSVSICFGQDWIWAKQIGGMLSDYGGAKIDAYDNIYCAGYFENNCFFEHDTLYASGQNDIFLAKYDENGNELWAKRIGADNPYGTLEYGSVGAIDNVNACFYFIGSFNGISLTIDGHSVSGSGGSDLFLAKFDLDGNCLWLNSAASNGNDGGLSLCLDLNNDIYFTGYLERLGTFDTISLPPGTFLSKLDPNGNILWVRKEISGDGSSCCMKIKDNNLIMSGTCANSDSTWIDTTLLIASHKNPDGFIARLDLNGNSIKAKRFNGRFPDYAGNFEIDSNNNIYLSGIFTDTISIDTSMLIANNTNGDMFFCKLDSTFNLIWIKQSHSTGAFGATASGVEKDIQGEYYITGYFSGNAVFGNYNVNSSVNEDMFIAKYDNNGNCLGIIHFGGAEPSSIATGSLNITSNTDLIIAGNFMNTINLGSIPLTSYGSYDMFFAKTTAITGITGEKGINNNNKLLIFANPTTGKCNITVPDDFSNEKNLTLNIFDNAGKLIQQTKLEMYNDKIKLDLEQEAKGIYNVTLSNGKQIYTGKIVFE